MTMIFIYTLDAKRPDSRTKLCEFSSKTVQRYNMHTIQKKTNRKTYFKYTSSSFGFGQQFGWQYKSGVQ